VDQYDGRVCNDSTIANRFVDQIGFPETYPNSWINEPKRKDEYGAAWIIQLAPNGLPTFEAAPQLRRRAALGCGG